MPIGGRSILVTGGAGFIGSTLAGRLIDRGAHVIAVDMLHPQVHPGYGRPDRLPEGVELLPLDITSRTAWDTVLKLVRPDCIVHLAAETGTAQSFSEASRHGNANVVGTTEMLDALLRWDAVPSQIILGSSRAVYGEGEWTTESGESFYPNPRTVEQLHAGRWNPIAPHQTSALPRPSRADRTMPRPTSVYGATKLAQEHILTAWCAGTGIDLTVLRFQNVYGPGQSLTNSYTGVVSLFARLANEGIPIEVFEDGCIVRDFVFVDDVVAALIASIDSLPSATPLVLDIGSGSTTTIHELALRISSILGAPAPKVTGSYRPGDVRAASTDISLAQSALTYRPTWHLEDGIGELLSWIGKLRS